MQVQRTHEIDRDDLFPDRRVDVNKSSAMVPAGVVDQHINRSEVVFDLGHGSLHEIPAGDVDGVAARRHTVCRKLRGKLFRRRAVQVEDRDA